MNAGAGSVFFRRLWGLPVMGGEAADLRLVRIVPRVSSAPEVETDTSKSAKAEWLWITQRYSSATECRKNRFEKTESRQTPPKKRVKGALYDRCRSHLCNGRVLVVKPYFASGPYLLSLANGKSLVTASSAFSSLYLHIHVLVYALCMCDVHVNSSRDLTRNNNIPLAQTLPKSEVQASELPHRLHLRQQQHIPVASPGHTIEPS